MLKEGKGLNAQRCFKLALDLYLNRVSYIGADKEDLPKGYLYVRGRETYRQLVQQHAPDMYFPNRTCVCL